MEYGYQVPLEFSDAPFNYFSQLSSYEEVIMMVDADHLYPGETFPPSNSFFLGTELTNIIKKEVQERLLEPSTEVQATR